MILNRQPVWALVLLASLTLMAGCSDDAESVSGETTDISGDSGELSDGGLLDASADTAESSDIQADSGPADSEKADSSQPDAGPEDAGVIKQPCDDNDECTSGSCLPTPEGRFCADVCVSSCAPDYKCQEILSSSDVVYVCVHKTPYRCSPCASDKDCEVTGKSGGVCVQLGGGGYCAQPCKSGDTASCVGDDFQCGATKTLDGSDTQACLPKSGECPCPDG
ncbi:MAG: hypothetical protein KC502_23175, partial [Myxococcales bacterium]|nr:hypothetical protein [Myxococcales bacterium]